MEIMGLNDLQGMLICVCWEIEQETHQVRELRERERVKLILL